ncbi:MAG: glutamine-hydrolyzing GMP synthase, partial [Bacteroidia bacterium]|nr:glutamine-hydrolyzing GMP synthase [Bacteroidia bacterium]
GSQYSQLIARRVRELHVYCEIHPYSAHLDWKRFKGIILSGSPASVNQTQAPNLNLEEFSEMPLLGICYGAQLLAKNYGGKVAPAAHREYGRAALFQTKPCVLFEGIHLPKFVWMSHSDSILQLPAEFHCIAQTDSIPVAAFAHQHKSWFGLQFHPEVTHSEIGKEVLANFLYKVCKCKGEWTAESFVHTTIERLKQQIGTGNVICALSGGVDSTVAAVLLQKAIGQQLTCVFVNNGLLRKNEFSEVLESYQQLGLNVRGVDASDRFLTALEGVDDPEKKRKIIGGLFIEVFEQEAKSLEPIEFLAQGTIYPDVIESVSVLGPSVTIKSHHNVGGLPERMNLKVVEPLRELFKDEVREVGKALRISELFLKRHPFPGPGLAIRILGAVSADKIQILQEADSIYIQTLREFGLYDQVWQAFAVLLPIQSVGVMGDERTYEYVLALRAVTSTDGMTADWAVLPSEFLATVSNRIINSVKGINRVVYDISSKPPATIEWE